MELHHTETTPTPIDTVWASFMDLHRVGSCFPGATVTDVRGDEFDGRVGVRVGPLKIAFVGGGRLAVKDEARRHAVIESWGEQKRGLGKAEMRIDLRLTEIDEGTRMDLVSDLQIRGLPSSLGQSVAEAVSGPLVRRFLRCMGS